MARMTQTQRNELIRRICAHRDSRICDMLSKRAKACQKISTPTQAQVLKHGKFFNRDGKVRVDYERRFLNTHGRYAECEPSAFYVTVALTAEEAEKAGVYKRPDMPDFDAEIEAIKASHNSLQDRVMFGDAADALAALKELESL